MDWATVALTLGTGTLGASAGYFGSVLTYRASQQQRHEERGRAYEERWRGAYIQLLNVARQFNACDRRAITQWEAGFYERLNPLELAPAKAVHEAAVELRDVEQTIRRRLAAALLESDGRYLAEALELQDTWEAAVNAFSEAAEQDLARLEPSRSRR